MLVSVSVDYNTSLIGKMMIPIKKVSPDNTRSYYLILVKGSKTTFRQTNNTYIFEVSLSILIGMTINVTKFKNFDWLV